MRIWIEGEIIDNSPYLVNRDYPCIHTANPGYKPNCGLFNTFYHEMNYFTLEGLYAMLVIIVNNIYPDIQLISNPLHSDIARAILNRRLGAYLSVEASKAPYLEGVFVQLYPILMYFVTSNLSKIPTGYPLKFPIRFERGTITFGVVV